MAVRPERSDKSRKLSSEPYVTPMRVGDIPEVLDIERRSFPTPWSQRAFETELLSNHYAHYMVVRMGDEVAGYGGMWVVLDEAHVTNVAVHPDYRGQHVGDRVLKALKERARQLGATQMTLEVRPSNFIARALYQKHGFKQQGRRKGYYSDTNEDALIMWRTL